jgi:hypothetical protein
MKALIALVAAAASALVVGTASADVSQTPIATACPAGFEVLSTAPLKEAGYKLPINIDEAGNNDGFVCGLERPEAVLLAQCGPTCPVTAFYVFRDNDSPAA